MKTVTKFSVTGVKSTHRNTLAVGCGSPVKARGMSRNTARYAAFSIPATSFGGSDGMAKAMPGTLRVPPVFHTHSSCRPMWKWNGSCHQAQLESSMTINLHKPCKKCSGTDFYANGGGCKACAKARAAAYTVANPEKVAASKTAWAKANPEKTKARGAAYRAANPEKREASQIAWRASNTEKIKANSAAYYAANAKKINASGAAWRAANPEKKRAWSAAYYIENAEKLRADHAAYRAAYPEKTRAQVAAWTLANADRVRLTNAAWAKANPDLRRIGAQNRRARKVASGGTLSKGLAAKLFKLQKGKCPCCALPLGTDCHLDHKMPLALGGSNTDGNIQLLRATCNLQKSAKHPVDFMQSRGFLL